jgi:hypothetical protein
MRMLLACSKDLKLFLTDIEIDGKDLDSDSI